HYPTLLALLRENLDPLVSKVRHEASIYSRLAGDCQKFVRRYQEQEEVFGHNDLLVQMRKAIDKPLFANQVRSNYAAAIVDEFQDTDPVQWEIFSQLFVPENHAWKGRLHLVGDPKQSIYAFRQADIYTYLDAAQKLGTGAVSTLGTNFRSHSSLIDALNILFSSAADTFALPKLSGSLQYRDVNAGRKDAASVFSGKPSLLFWEVRYERKKGKIPLKDMETDFLFSAIVKEILLLNEQEGIRFGQFAILISDQYQAARVCEYLREHDIPVKNQRGADFTFSHAVAEMRDLLNGVLNYGNTSSLNVALAGRLIGMAHWELQLLEDEETLFRIVKQLDGLKSILNQSGFAAFFSAFMRSSWHPDGKCVLVRLLKETNGLQFLREWQDLSDLLIAEEQSRNLFPHGVVAFLDELEELSRNEDERIKVYLNPDEDGVSVMTTHISKGLEFDIVIALGLINEREQKTNDLIALEMQNGFSLCSVEDKNDPRYLKFCEESDAEKMRQLYVALTRAKDRMYVPFAVDEDTKEVPVGSASPLDLFIAKLDKAPTDYAGLYSRIAAEDGSTIARVVARYPDKFGLEVLQKQLTPLPKRKPASSPLLEAPGHIKIPSQLQSIQSFTSLSHTKTAGSQDTGNALIVPHDFISDDKNEHTLPSGSDTGVLLHKIFENVSFDLVKNMSSPMELNDLIVPYLRGTAYEAWEDAIATIIFKTLKSKLSKNGFCLADVDPKKIYRETEFLYPCDPKSRMLNDATALPGYLKGVVDVFFEHDGKFYLLDWKSNWLGPTQDYYQPKHLEAAMKANNYDLQAAIYREAFERYLKIFDKRPFEDIFGGIIYLFVRGVGSDSGIYTLGVK
ncbi:MAG TPA: UvrD-helicase domain-containing protein, partial [Parachlamydiaceae bacterium]|nr:UvrD-helicase domain-containing protein [Parachlamydiaceae bacterium]